MKRKKRTTKKEFIEELIESKCPMCEKIHMSTAKYKYCHVCKNSKRFKNFNKTEVEVTNDYVKSHFSEE